MEVYIYFFKGQIVTSQRSDLVEPYIKLSSEQLVFFEANPGASVQEVKACALNTILLEDYRASKIAELSALSLTRGYELFSQHQRDNLLSGVEGLPYTLAQLKQLNTDCRTEYYRVKTLIEATTTLEGVDEAFNSNNYANITI